MRDLTRRQMQIARLRCERGMTNKEVARDLGIALSTVKSTWTTAMKNLGTRGIGQSCWVLADLHMVPGQRAEQV